MSSVTGLTLQLIGEDGNAFGILGKADKIMRKAGYSKEERDTFRSNATSGDYNNLLCVCMEWFDVE